MHKPLFLKNLSLSFPHKICFDGFNGQINFGDRIALIGRNGSGKSSLFKILQKLILPTNGEVNFSSEVRFGHLPQIIETPESFLSGGEKLNDALTKALCFSPNILLLDEPTNHLDAHNRRSLIRMLSRFQGTLLIAPHDLDLIHYCTTTLWHIDQGKIHIFSGAYEDYMRENRIQRTLIEHELHLLKEQKKETHQALMKEQERAKKSDLKGQKSISQRKWPTIVSEEKARRAIETSGKKRRFIRTKHNELLDQLSTLRLPEIITPKFSLNPFHRSEETILSIQNGTLSYDTQVPLLRKILTYP